MKRIKVLQLQTEFKVKPVDVSDLPEQIIKAFPKEHYEFVSGYLIRRPTDKIHDSIAEKTVYLNFEKQSLKGLRIALLWGLFKFLRKEKFDVIICHRFKPVSLLTKISNWIGNPLSIAVVHSFSDYRLASRRRLIKNATAQNWHYVAVSPALKTFLIRLNSGFSERNTTAITNAIDVQKVNDLQLDKTTARRALGLPEEAVIIGTIGRLVPIKGHVYLIRAFADVAKDFPNARLAIIGAGRELSNLQKELSRLNVSDKVYLLGQRDAAVRYLKAFNIWTLPSFSEGLGLALLEGMSASLPFVASDIPAMQPLIEGAGGIACKPGDTETLAKGLRYYLGLSDSERAAQGEKSYRYVTEHHDIETFRTGYRQLVEKLYDKQ